MLGEVFIFKISASSGMRKINKKETFQNVKLSLFSYKGISVLMFKKKTMVMTNDNLVSFVFKYVCLEK